jgi:hypothetical protein
MTSDIRTKNPDSNAFHIPHWIFPATSMNLRSITLDNNKKSQGIWIKMVFACIFGVVGVASGKPQQRYWNQAATETEADNLLSCYLRRLNTDNVDWVQIKGQ